MPSNVTVHEKAFELQMNIVKAKGIPSFMGMLTRNDFLSTADLRTKQLAYLTVLKVCKLLFAVAGHSLGKKILILLTLLAKFTKSGLHCNKTCCFVKFEF